LGLRLIYYVTVEAILYFLQIGRLASCSRTRNLNLIRLQHGIQQADKWKKTLLQTLQSDLVPTIVAYYLGDTDSGTGGVGRVVASSGAGNPWERMILFRMVLWRDHGLLVLNQGKK
jgi:hypothetical protein